MNRVKQMVAKCSGVATARILSRCILPPWYRDCDFWAAVRLGDKVCLYAEGSATYRIIAEKRPFDAWVMPSGVLAIKGLSGK